MDFSAFSSLFRYSALAGAFALVAVPILIHIINMMRHRRVKWAAMEFVLLAYKRNRTWIWLKQFLLLLARMLAFAAIVALMAGFDPQDDRFKIKGDAATHHYVLLDDSFSMADRVGGETAFERAQAAVQQIARRAAQEPGQLMTLLRFSQADHHRRVLSQGADGGDAALLDKVADLFNAPVPFVDQGDSDAFGDFERLLKQRSKSYRLSHLAVGPTAAMDIVRQLVDGAKDDRHIVYVISDFRSNQWRGSTQIKSELAALEEMGADLHLVSCTRRRRGNLAVTQLTPAEGTRSTGISLPMNVSVTNYGQEDAAAVTIEVRVIRFDPDTRDSEHPDRLVARSDRSYTTVLKQIKAGETAETRVKVRSHTPGRQVVQARIVTPDPVDVDNYRWCVVDFAERVPALIVDGSLQQWNAYHLLRMFSPSRTVDLSGIRPEAQLPAQLREMTIGDLRKYHSVYLTDVSRLDSSTVKLLEQFVSEGGGLAVFMGPSVDASFYNDLFYNEGSGLFPIRIGNTAKSLPADPRQPDFTHITHPIFRGDVSSLLVARYIPSPDSWKKDVAAGARVLATMRTGEPLIVEKDYGKGRVVAVMTTLAPYKQPQWNDVAVTKLGVAVCLSLQSYLGETRHADVPRVTGSQLRIALPVGEYGENVAFVRRQPVEGQQTDDAAGQSSAAEQGQPDDPDATEAPSETEAAAEAPDAVDDDTYTLSPSVLTRRAKADSGQQQAVISLGGRPDADERMGWTDLSGIYEIWTKSIKDGVQVQRYAINVDNAESNLQLMDAQQLNSALGEVSFQYHGSGSLDQLSVKRDPESPWTKYILYGLIALLIGEQILAYSASYHTTRGGLK